MQRQNRLKRELEHLAADSSIFVHQKQENDLYLLEAQIIGPENSPYDKGVFKLEIKIPENYPISPPSIKFVTKIYHPNIDENGRICLDLIKMPPNGNWNPTIGIKALLIAIRMLLETPNPDNPLVIDIAEEYIKSKDIYINKAKEYTEKYAR